MPEEDKGDMIPRWRLNEEINKRTTAESELERVNKKLEAVQKIAEKVPDLETKNKNLTATLEDTKADFGRRGILNSKGITDSEDQDLILTRWKNTPEESRKDLDKWISSEGKNDRQVNRILAEITAKTEAAKTEATKTEAAKTETGTKETKVTKESAENKDLPDAGKNVQTPVTAGKELTPEQILGMSVADLKKNEAAIFGSSD